MKSKKTKYILIPIVLIIWGIIIIRVINMLNPSDDYVFTPIVKTEKRIEKKEEKFELLMNYSDPFNSSTTVKNSYYQSYQPVVSNNTSNSSSKQDNLKTTTKSNNKTSKNQSKKNEQNSNINIQYIGMVNNSNPQTKTAYIQLNNKYYLCQPGDSIQSLIIQSFTKDKLTINRNDSIIYFDKISSN